MDKYNKQIIYDYINGTTIEDYTLEELENDKKFMKMVIGITHNKKTYERCSKTLKQDPEFIKYILAIFNSDIEFISSIMDEYIKTSTDLQTFTELIVLICEYTKNTDKFSKYEKYRELIYLDFKAKIELTKQEYIGTNIEKEIGMGFIFIFDFYNHCKSTLNYFATNFIADIFNEYDVDLEELIHNDFNTFNNLEEYGINKYILNFINKYDYSLSNYVTTNRLVLKPILKKLEKIKQEWDLYPEKKLTKQYELMFEKVFDYMQKINNSTLKEVELIYYLSGELGISKTLKEHDLFMKDELYDHIIENMDNKIESLKFNLYDIKYITDVKNIMIETLELKDTNKHNENNLKQRILKKVLIKNNKQDN